MMQRTGVVVAAACLCGARAQQAGTNVKEEGPEVPVKFCTVEAGCVAEDSTATLDANWRWTHISPGYENCYTDGEWSSVHCSDPVECASKCAVEGVDKKGYKKTYGISKVKGGLELDFVASSGNVGSRLYLLDSSDSYKMFKLKNREFTLDVDTSSLECGINGAVYFVEMSPDGDMGKGKNEAGAKFGVGYCDAQCPHDIKWMEGEANVKGEYGTCCVEMDIWEANKQATAYTAHTCDLEGPLKCKGESCGDGDKGGRYKGVCDKDGCDHNAYRMGDQSFYGAGNQFAVDSSKPVTIVTQFLTHDGTDEGDLVDIRRLYVQNGKVINLPNSTHSGIIGNSLSDEFCSSQKEVFNDPNDFKVKGGMKNMGKALDRGLVLALSIWDDGATNMRWLDSSFPVGGDVSTPGVARGPCDGEHSSPEYVRNKHKSASVKYTNIKYGEIGSTYTAGRRLDAFLA